MDDTVYKIAIAGFLHDIGKFAERAGMDVPTEYLNNNAGLYQPYNKVQNRHTHKHAVYTAAFIEYIEKLLPKEFNRGGWGLDDAFINLAAGHHAPETPMQWVIAVADRVSSGMDRATFQDYNEEIKVQDYRKTRLLALTEGISTEDCRKEDSIKSYLYRYPLKKMSPQTVFPEKEADGDGRDQDLATREYQELFSGFIDSLRHLAHKENIPLWFEHFDSVFMIYSSNIPAATVGMVVPDVSLYDHARTTAALAAAVYLYHAENKTLSIKDITDYDNKKFLLVTGDFYGIQDFIFSAGGSTNKVAAKLLRGRSFAVSLISELAADMLCREIGIPVSCVVLNAFTVIAPNTDRTRNSVEAVERKINKWLIERFYGEASLGMSSIEACCNEFKSDHFSDLWDAVTTRSDSRKYDKIPLDIYGGVVEGYLDGFDNDLEKKLCPFCGKRPSSARAENDPLLGDETSACIVCRDHIYFGTNLVKTQRIAVTNADAEVFGDKLLAPVFDYYQISMDVEGRLSRLADQGKLLRYWDVGVAPDGMIAKDISVKFISGHVPVYSDADRSDDTVERLLHGKKSQEKIEELFDMIMREKGLPKTFEHISKMALNKTKNNNKYRGTEALGILKADLDNLGLIFACGLKHQSISTFATLSRQISHFFSIYLPYTLSTRDKFRDIYTVFSGGDDLFFIGPWNRVIDFAIWLNDSFKEFACDNSIPTISAGIKVCKTGTPVPFFAKLSEEALAKSKAGGKNCLTLFDETVSWDNLRKLREIQDTLQNWLEAGTINNAMLYRLNHFIEMAGKEKELAQLHEAVSIDSLECLKWKSWFKYSVARNIGLALKGKEKEKMVDEVSKAAAWLETYGTAMRIALWQVIYNQR